MKKDGKVMMWILGFMILLNIILMAMSTFEKMKYQAARFRIEDTIRKLRQGIAITPDLTREEHHYICQGMKIAANIIEEKKLDEIDFIEEEQVQRLLDEIEESEKSSNNK